MLNIKTLEKDVPATKRVIGNIVKCGGCDKKGFLPHGQKNVTWDKRPSSFGLYETFVKTGIFLEKRLSSLMCSDFSKIEYHICPTCFERKLLPFLEKEFIGENIPLKKETSRYFESYDVDELEILKYG